MIAQLTSLALVIAALLFLLSLPLGDHEAGRSLRRAAGFAFAMAFVPSILVCVFAPLFHQARSPAMTVQLVLAVIGGAAILAVLALAAYGFLDLRSRGRNRQPSAHGEDVRYAKERPSQRAHGGDEHDDGGEYE